MRQLCAAASCSDARDCCVTESCVGADAAVANLQREQCLSMGGRRRKSSASVLRPVGVLAAYGTLSKSLVVHHHDQMQANAVWQRAAWVLVPRSLIYSASNAYRWAAGAENPAHLFRGQLWCLQRTGHEAGACWCIIMIRCRQMPCRREQRGCWCRGR